RGRKLDNEHVASADSRLDPDAAPVELDRPARDRQTEPAARRAAAPRGLRAVEPIEDSLPFTARECLGGVVDHHLEPVVEGAGREADGAAGWRELDRVFDEICRDASDQSLVAPELDRTGGIDGHRNPTARGERSEGAGDLEQQLAQVDQLVLER